jgi:beta-lactamase superfamily II metal-dependent hydrolase
MFRQADYDWTKVKEANTKSGKEHVDTYKTWQETYNQPAPKIDWGFDLYHHDYLTPAKAKEVEETKIVNNSSVPVIITYEGTEHQEKFLFAGDLEENGWKELLSRKSFKDSIKGTDFFITAHHGYSSGYCKEIFDAMGKPIVNIVSAHRGDESVETAYSKSDNAHGITINDEKRYMLTTRSDGSIKIDVNSEGKYSLSLKQFADNQK